jgi:flagellar assembly protein FliH
MQEVFQNLDASLIDMQQHMAQQVLELACDIARQVVRQELSVNPNALQPVVREAVGMLVNEGRPATVRLNPADMDAMAQPLREEMDAPGVQWMSDAAVPAGGCLVESAGTVVDGSLAKRWQRAIASLGLQSPWAEEGGDDH